MAEENETLELKFRIFDGTDIGHGTYSSSTTAATLKQKLLSEWPQDKSVVPKSVSDMKLIHAGKVLENEKTLADSGVHVGDVTGGLLPCMWLCNLQFLNRRQVRTRRKSKISTRALALSFRATNRTGASC